MPKLDTYTFGSILVGGDRITSDLIIFPDGTVKKEWWREIGHRVIPEDLSDLLASGPDTLVIGTGASGLMVVSDELLTECQARGIEVRAMPTAEAVIEYNRHQRAGMRVGACFHLTC